MEKCIQYWGQNYSKSSGQKYFLVSHIKFTIFRNMDTIFSDNDIHGLKEKNLMPQKGPHPVAFYF